MTADKGCEEGSVTVPERLTVDLHWQYHWTKLQVFFSGPFITEMMISWLIFSLAKEQTKMFSWLYHILALLCRQRNGCCHVSLFLRKLYSTFDGQKVWAERCNRVSSLSYWYSDTQQNEDIGLHQKWNVDFQLLKSLTTFPATVGSKF